MLTLTNLILFIIAWITVGIVSAALRFIFGGPRRWNGPQPRPEDRARAENFISDYIHDFPNNCGDLPKDFPAAARKAQAVRKYRELNRLFAQGQIDFIDYNLELEKILPLIDISEDLRI